MRAMIVKEFRQLGRDKRTLGLLGGIPLLLLIVFGFAASFDVSSVPTVVHGPPGDTGEPGGSGTPGGRPTRRRRRSRTR